MWAPLERDFLHKTNELIDARLNPMDITDKYGMETNTLKTICRHLCNSDHAKRARPLFCLYAHWMLSENLPIDFLNVGVAAEFIHAASLLHDDIVDEAEKRRGKSSANRLFGNAKAVLAGDFLLTEAFDLLKPFERPLIDKAISVIREMTKSAIVELEIRGNADVSLDVLRGIAKGKTGVLFSWCGFSAGLLCNDVEAAERFWHVGERIGLIFQMADDIKDFDGDKSLKDACRDIRNFEPSMPFVLAAEKNPLIKSRWRDAHLSGEIQLEQALELRDLVIKSGAIAEIRRFMAYELDAMMSELAPYNGTKGKSLLDRWVLALAST